MKNNLTKEELLLKEKLQEASFSYQENDWVELQKNLGNKKGGSNFGLLFRTVIVLSVIVGGIFLTYGLYDAEESTITTQPQNTTQVKGTAKLANKPTTQENTTSPSIEKELSQQASNKVINSEKEVKNATAKPEEKQTLNSESPNENNEQQAIFPVSPEKKEPSKVFFTINTIKLSPEQCLNTPIQAELAFNTNSKQDITMQWFLDQQPLKENKFKALFEISTPGSHTLTVQAYTSGRLLSEKSASVYVKEPIELDFTVKDSEDPFSDMMVELESTQKVSNLEWAVNGKKIPQKASKVIWDLEREGVYNVVLSHQSEEGCIYKTDKTIELKQDFQLYAPEAFTPNYDNVNDVFLIKSFENIDAKYTMQITDLSGKTVFQTNSSVEGWNGRLNNVGNILPKSTYAWTIQIENKNGLQKVYSGKVKLLDF